MSHKILFLNGPNLNLLGTREPEVYGADTLDDMVAETSSYPAQNGTVIEAYQSNVEGELIDRLHEARVQVDGVVFNPEASTQCSYALRDAIGATGLPVVETHLSNVHAREEFRHRSVLAGMCVGVVAGFGRDSYRVTPDALLLHVDRTHAVG
jgi:3-dehydroquinate dehydratase-2